MTWRPPEPPELPEAARPRWGTWYGPAALGTSLLALVFVALPVFPLLVFAESDGAVGAISLLVLILLQDLCLCGSALVFAQMKLPPRPWHFGLRATPFWRTAGWAALGFAVLFGFELGYIEVLGIDQSNTDDLGADEGLLAAIAVQLAVIVVAPVTEEFFFRGFFYRALRTRLRVWSAALIDGAVFGSLHFEGVNSVEILPVIAVFGVGQCFVYERTGSLYPVIAIHAAFNTVASLGDKPGSAVAIGLIVIAGCILVPRRNGPAPSPFGPYPRRPRALPA